MGKYKAYIFLGIWIAVLPFLGFPRGFKDLLISLSGIFVALLPFLIFLYSLVTTRKPRRRRMRVRKQGIPGSEGINEDEEGAAESSSLHEQESREDRP